MRHLTVASLLLSSWVVASPAGAQPAIAGGWVDVNVGALAPADDAFAMTATTRLFSEDADFRTDYAVTRGETFDAGGGVMLTPVLGVVANVSFSTHSDRAVLSARIPHPFYGSLYAAADAETDTALQRAERGVHLHAMFVAAETGRVRVRVFGGPSYIHVGQDAVTGIEFRQFSTIVPPANRIEIDKFTQARVTAGGWGFHAGADAAYFFTRIVGVGGFAKFSRATVELENTLAARAGSARALNVRGGGFHIGAGLRVRI